MPYVSERIPLTGMQDRRRRLTDEQKAEIQRIYATGQASYRSLASQFHVDKSTIGIIVSPERAEKMRQYNVEHWREHKQSKSDRAKAMREHRHYKQSLFLSGQLTP